jgi:hypothetical protein
MFAFDYGEQTVVDVLGHFVVLGIGVFRPDILDRPEKYTNVKGTFRNLTEPHSTLSCLPTAPGSRTYR